MHNSLKHTPKTSLPLDPLDRKLLYYLDINSRQSTTQLAKKTGSNKDTINYRLHRLTEQKIVTRFTTATNTAYLGYENIKVYLQFQNFDHEIEKQFFSYLRTIPRIGWIVRCSGRWDAIFCYWAESKFEFYSTLLVILNKFSQYIRHKEIIHNINWFYYNRKWLHPTEIKIYPTKYGEKPQKEQIDKLDQKIIKTLIQDARTPIKDIALHAETSSQNIINRIKHLQDKSLITKFSIDLNYEKLDLILCKTFIYLDNITKEKLEQLYNYCAKEPTIFALTTTLGAWDLELEFEVHKFEEAIQSMEKLREKFKEIVRSYESIIITKQSEIIYIGE